MTAFDTRPRKNPIVGYTTEEGGKWLPWKSGDPVPPVSHSILYENGKVWDRSLNSWRTANPNAVVALKLSGQPMIPDGAPHRTDHIMLGSYVHVLLEGMRTLREQVDGWRNNTDSPEARILAEEVEDELDDMIKETIDVISRGSRGGNPAPSPVSVGQEREDSDTLGVWRAMSKLPARQQDGGTPTLRSHFK